MSDFYDESGFSAPQLGHPTGHDRIMSQSGHDGEHKHILKTILQNPLALPGLIIVIAGGVLTIY